VTFIGEPELVILSRRGVVAAALKGLTIMMVESRRDATQSPGGEIGRRNGLKIRFLVRGVRVQFPPRAPLSLLIHGVCRFELARRRHCGVERRTPIDY
jgi:hypothetical protein